MNFVSKKQCCGSGSGTQTDRAVNLLFSLYIGTYCTSIEHSFGNKQNVDLNL